MQIKRFDTNSFLPVRLRKQTSNCKKIQRNNFRDARFSGTDDNQKHRGPISAYHQVKVVFFHSSRKNNHAQQSQQVLLPMYGWPG